MTKTEQQELAAGIAQQRTNRSRATMDKALAERREIKANPKRYRVPVYRIAMVREDSAHYEAHPRPSLNSAVDVAAFLSLAVSELLAEMLGDSDREHLAVVTLDARRKPIGVNLVATGGLTNAPVHPREVLKLAILQNAAAIILAHNHPSGDPSPSYDDRNVTRQMAKACRLMGLEILDHIILGERGSFYSFATSDPSALRDTL